MNINKSSGNSNNILIKLLGLLFAFYLVIFPLNITPVFRLIMFLTYGVVLLIEIIYFKSKINAIDFILQSICITVVIVGYIFSGLPINLDTLQTIFCFISLVILIGAQNLFICDKNLHDFIFKIAVFVGIVFSIYSFMPFAYYNRGTTKNNLYLTLNLDNTNFTGIVLFFVFSLLWIEIKNRKHKFLYYSLEAYLFYMIYLTNSRTCIVSAIVLISYTLFFSSKPISNKIILASVLFPFIFLPIYVYLYNSGMDNIIIGGKELFSGRIEIYMRYLNKITNLGHVLFGNMKEMFFLNSGNGPLAIFCSGGMVTMISFYILLYRNLIRSNKKCISVAARVSIITMLAFSIHSSAESSMVLGGIVSLFSYLILFILTHDREEKI